MKFLRIFGIIFRVFVTAVHFLFILFLSHTADTIVNFTVLDDIPAEYMQLDAELESQGLYPVYAWEVDAGLADDEVIPGEFEVEIDLEALGIDPAFYPCLSVGRAGEDGGRVRERELRRPYACLGRYGIRGDLPRSPAEYRAG